MINFRTITWKNFLSTGNQPTTVQLDRSITTLIIGDNGAGKSTILDALCFVLFGKPFRNINKAQLLNSVNQREALVTIEFEVGGKNVKVIRGIKPNVFEVYVNDKMVNQDASARDYQKYLEEQILKLNYRSFTQVVILGSSTFVPFMQLPAKQRRDVVEDILDIKIFSLMNMLLKQKTKDVAEDIRNVEYQYDLTKDKIELQEKYIEDLKKNKSDQVSKINTKIEENNEALVTKKEKKRALEIENEFLTRDVDDKSTVETKIRKFHKTEAALQNRKTEDENKVKFFTENENCPTCTQEIDQTIRQEKIAERVAKIEEIESALTELNKLTNEQQERLDSIHEILKKVRDNEVEIAKLSTSITELETYNQNLITDRDSYESGSVSEGDKTKLAELNGQLKLIEDQKSKLNEDKFYVDVAKNLLQDSGIKTKIVKQYLPIMNKLVNTYLSSMDFFVKFELDENFNETIKSRFRDEFSYASFSEGEKMRIDLALLFTWRAVAKMKNSTNTNLLILDEIFDSSLDGAGTDDFLKILSHLGDTNVFIISHKGDTLYDKFRSILKFEKVKNFSRIAQ